MRLRLVVMEPSSARWSVLREQLSQYLSGVVNVVSPRALCTTLDHCEVDAVLIGKHADLEGHRAAAERLAQRSATVMVVADRKSPRTVAEYLRIGPEIAIVPAEPTQLVQALREVMGLNETERFAAINFARTARPRRSTDELPLQ